MNVPISILSMNINFNAQTVGFRDDVRQVSSQTYDPPQFNFTYTISNNGQQTVVPSSIVFSTDNIEETAKFEIGTGEDNYLAPLASSSRSNIISLPEESPSKIEVRARLQYFTLPSHNTITCFTQASYSSSSKGKGKGKGAPPSSSKGKGSQKNSKGGDTKGKGSNKQSKRGYTKGNKSPLSSSKGKGSIKH